MSSEVTSSTQPSSRWEKRLEELAEKYPLSTPATSGYGKKIQHILAEHARKQQEPGSPAQLQRQDSAALITAKQNREMARREYKRTVQKAEQAVKAAERHRDKELMRKRANGVVPLHVSIEHCRFKLDRNEASKMGKAMDRISKFTKVSTFHYPLKDINCTPFSTVCEEVHKAYDSQFGVFHRKHQHPNRQTGDLIMELYVRYLPYGAETLVCEENWQSVLESLNVITPQHMRGSDSKTIVATLIARFTCAAGPIELQKSSPEDTLKVVHIRHPSC